MENFVRVDTVGADCDGLSTELFNITIRVGNCREFGWSNKSKIAGIKKQQEPFAKVILAADLDFLTAIISW